MKEILLKGIIGRDLTAGDIRKQLPSGREAVRILINSEGGDVFESFEIYNMLKEYPGKVTARVVGLAASAAADLFFGADEREWFEHAAVMYHRAWSIVLGDAREMRETADILDSLDRVRFKDFCRVTCKSLEQVEQEFTAETWLIGDEQIRGAGITGVLVDGEAPEEAPPEPAAAKKRVQASREMLLEARRKEGAETEKTAAQRRAAIQALADVSPADYCPKSENTEEGGANMDLKEFLAQNPCAEADVLAYAKTKSTGETETAVKAETERIGKLLALGGVQLSDEIKAAVQGGKTAAEYAVAELTKQREIQAKHLQGTPPAPPGYVAQTPAEQTGNPREEPPPDTLTEDELSAYAARRYRGA